MTANHYSKILWRSKEMKTEKEGREGEGKREREDGGRKRKGERKKKKKRKKERKKERKKREKERRQDRHSTPITSS